jgi:hypothetical protein
MFVVSKFEYVCKKYQYEETMKKEKSIFELVEIAYNDEKPKYPEFEVYKCRVGLFTSLDKTEQAMKKRIVEIEDWQDTPRFGFLILERALDKSVFRDAKSRRSYLSDGAFWDETLVSEIPDKDGNLEPFLGRPADKIRFNIGDFVELLGYETVTLGIVGNLPCKPEEVRPGNDFTDDSYYCLDQNGDHSHPAAVDLFPARLTINKALREKLLSDEYKRYKSINE